MSDRGAPQLAGLLALCAIAWIVGYWLWPAEKPGEPPVTMTRAAEVEGGAEPAVVDDSRAQNPPPALEDPVAPDPDPAVADEPVVADQDGFEGVEPPTYRIHTVDPRGETLQDISMRYYGTTSKWRAIARMNGHAVDPNRLLPGTEVKVPRDPDNVQGASMDDGEPDPEPETTHTDYIVSKDDSLWTIAKALYGSGVKWTVIRDANRDLVGDQGQRLRPGMVLKIPPPPGG